MSSNKFTKEIIDHCAELYKSGKYLYQIAEIYQTTASNILYHFRLNNIPTRDRSSSSKKYSFNEDYFKSINTEEKAYFLGLLYADGCNTRLGLSIALSDVDSETIELLKNAISYSGPLLKIPKRSENQNNQIKLSINSKYLSDDLLNLGVIPSKSETIEFPKENILPKNLIYHFIRGYFDGDGSVGRYNNGIQISIVGNLKFIQVLQQILIENCNISQTKLYITKNNPNIVVMSYSGRLQCERISDYLYKDSNIYMKRKYQIFKNTYLKKWKRVN